MLTGEKLEAALVRDPDVCSGLFGLSSFARSDETLRTGSDWGQM